MVRAIKVLGYHGTSRKAGDIILTPGGDPAQQFLSKVNKSDWLGDGVYFFQDAPYHAREWPMLRMPEMTRIAEPVVLCAELDLTENCLDLLDIRNYLLIANEYDKMRSDLERKSRRLPENKGPNRRLDCALVNFAIEAMAERDIAIYTVRAAFAEGEPIVPGSQIYSHAHVQIVVRPGHNHVISDVRLYNFAEGEKSWT